jgi:O-acetyl-ADP-ribose deacetylase (regulator of RNase III)
VIELQKGNLLKADAEALVNTVNCVGVMGKGIALQFKQAFPENFSAYEKACKKNQIQLGQVHVFPTGRLLNPKYIINFPTKKHWRAKSQLSDIESGLDSLVEVISQLNIRSIALPPLGCGYGGLEWPEVEPLIKEKMGALPEVTVLLFAPRGAPKPDEMRVGTKRPKMTRGRALLIKLLDLYGEQGYRHSLLEIQKLAYFLQEAGEPLRLKFVKYHYGPYAENLHYVLQRMEGHFIRGYGDRSGDAEIFLLPGAKEEADEFLGGDRDAEERVNHVRRLIEGFETPYGVELLSTVHWVAKTDSAAACDPDRATKSVQEWNSRKHQIFKPQHIHAAWKRLRLEGLVATC